MATWTASAVGPDARSLIAAAILATAGSEWALLAGAVGAGLMFTMCAQPDRQGAEPSTQRAEGRRRSRHSAVTSPPSGSGSPSLAR